VCVWFRGLLFLTFFYGLHKRGEREREREREKERGGILIYILVVLIRGLFFWLVYFMKEKIETVGVRERERERKREREREREI